MPTHQMKTGIARKSGIRPQTRDDRTFAEFFAGIGLVHEGLRASGWACVYANDIDPKKREMYVSHFGETPYYHLEDVWNADAVLERFTARAFLATASFPCIDLSLAGHWRGFDGDHSSTYFGFLEVLRRLGGNRPHLVMLENVAGFLTSRRGEDFKRAVCDLASLGYWIDALIVDAKWFVPQSRPRLFVFGFHESLSSPLVIRQAARPDMDDPWRYVVTSTPALRRPSLVRVMENVSLETGWATIELSPPAQVQYALTDHIDLDDHQEWWDEAEIERHYRMMEISHKKRVDRYRAAGTTIAGTAFRRTRRGKTRTEVRFDIAGCLRTPKGGSAKQIVVVIDSGRLRMRWMSPREYARLQGAENFVIAAPRMQALYGFGDAVCVPVIRWIDANLLTPLFESEAKAEITTDDRHILAR